MGKAKSSALTRVEKSGSLPTTAKWTHFSPWWSLTRSQGALLWTAWSILMVNPEIPEAFALTSWMRRHSTRFSGKSTSVRMSLGTESSWRHSMNKHGGENEMGEGGKSDGTPG
ncbi:uncharacterized protein LOC144212656 isoform X1 [Stigmatopora nigra]